MPFRPAVVVIHPAVQADYDRWEALAKSGKQPAAAIWKRVQLAVSRVKADGQWGEVIPRSKIPAHFTTNYGVTNLYCVDLASFHRCFYTIRDRDVIFLDIVDHATYDRLFGVKKR